MSQSTNRKGVIVGLFVFFGIAIIVAAVLTLGGQKKTFLSAVQVFAVFKDVNGLAVGNNVWFSGVKIGTIKDISFAPDASVLVQMSIEEKVKKFIPADARVRISSDGLIGNKIVVIFGGSPNAPRIQQDSRLATEVALNPEEVLTTLQANNQNLLSITNNFKLISERLASGKGSVGKLLTSDELFNDLQTTVKTLNRTTENARSITSDISTYTSKLNNKGVFADAIVSDTVIFSQLRAITTQINEVTLKADDVAAQLAQAASQINDTNTPAGALLHDKAVADDIKATLQNLRAGSEKLDENMEALQHNFLFRGFFRRKTKQEKQ